MTDRREKDVATTRRAAILDAAEMLVMDLGAAHLTMDAVAARAAVSKGGVLHHFPTKVDLIKGMLDRLLTMFENDAVMIERVAGPRLKDQLRGWIRLIQTTDEKLDRISAALLSASANQPDLLGPFAKLMRDRNAHYRRENAEFGAVLVILTALDGFWLFSALGLNPMSSEDMAIFFEALGDMVEQLQN
jgi:AcrR family transcriptional regulator